MTVDELKNSATSAARSFVSSPMNMATLLADLDATKVSHVLFALRPQALDSRNVPTAEIPTNHLRGFIVRAAAELDVAQQSQFFNEISAHPWFKGSAGYVFEKFVHVRLLTNLSSKPLEAIPARPGLPRLIIPACKNVIPLGGLSRLKEANKYTLPFYWRPTSQSFTSVDAVICTKPDILFVQSTVAPKHGAKPEGVDNILDHLPVKFRDARNWCLIFITDTEERATALRKQKFKELKNMRIYSCVFKIGQSALTSEERTLLEELTVSRR
jgi:hypothetical protein